MENFDNAYWRYQLINSNTEENPVLNIHEVWINKDSEKVFSYSENPIDINGWDNTDDLVGSLEMILRCCKKFPILQKKEIENIISK